MNKILIQFKREFWESRASFVWTPLIIGGILMGLLLLGIIPAQVELNQTTQQMDFNDDQHSVPEYLHQLKIGDVPSIPAEFLIHGLAAIYTLFTAILLLVLATYLSGALYSDRRDQSILFWKSLPVTERQNVLTKLAAAVFGAPLFYAAAALITGAFFLLIFMVYAGLVWNLPVPDLGGVVATFFVSTMGLVTGWWLLILWMLPIFCWLLLCSAIARKTPLLIALGIPLALIVLEAWVFGDFQLAGVVKHQVHGAFAAFQKVLHHPAQFRHELVATLSAPAVWIGLVISAAMLAACVWLRTFKYEI